jgi:GT2 family glycosyltransferase
VNDPTLWNDDSSPWPGSLQAKEPLPLSIIATIGPLTHEILVVDNCSTDDSVELVRSSFPGVQLVASEHNLGFSRAANLAIRQSRGNYILIAHPDVCFESGAISELVSWLREHDRTGVVGANLVYPDGTFHMSSLTKRNVRRELCDFGFPLDRIERWITRLCQRIGLNLRPFYWDHRTSVDTAAVWNACMMFKRQVLAEIGPFDDSFFCWYADTDWCYRARHAGWKVTLVASARVVHYERQSGGLLDGAAVRYKVDGTGVIGAMQRDAEVLYRKHFGLAYRVLASGLCRLAGWKAHVAARVRGTRL